jgi:hypothetical protein
MRNADKTSPCHVDATLSGWNGLEHDRNYHRTVSTRAPLSRPKSGMGSLNAAAILLLILSVASDLFPPLEAGDSGPQAPPPQAAVPPLPQDSGTWPKHAVCESG